jgi:hypothetical protein
MFCKPDLVETCSRLLYKNKIYCFDIVPYSRESIWPAQLRCCVTGHEKRTVGFGQGKTLRRSTANSTVSNKIVVWGCILIKIYNDRFSYVRRTLRCSCTVRWQHYMTADWQTLSIDAFIPIVARLQAAVDCRAVENFVTVLFLLMLPDIAKSTALFEVSENSPACP